MLDLDHPLTRFVFEACRYEDAIHTRLMELKTNPDADRNILLNEILCRPLPELRRLLRERFDNDERLARKLDALEDAILTEQPIEQLWQLYRAIEDTPGNFGTEWI